METGDEPTARIICCPTYLYHTCDLVYICMCPWYKIQHHRLDKQSYLCFGATSMIPPVHAYNIP